MRRGNIRPQPSAEERAVRRAEDHGRNGNRSRPAATNATVTAEASSNPTAIRVHSVAAFRMPRTAIARRALLDVFVIFRSQPIGPIL
jgi:hypothetical protein